MSHDFNAFNALAAWTGRAEETRDQITAAPLRGLAALLDRGDPPPAPGTPVPPLWHWLYFLPQTPQSALGEDGHERRGDFLPPVPLPRRMWAGGRLRWNVENPLLVGDPVRRNSRVESVLRKRGRSGDLVFVRVEHEIHNARGLALSEEHDIVYREAPAPGAAPAAAEPAEIRAPWQRELVPDAVLLFRYSALTFNGHRIHYDRGYATEVDGYPGLVVHGPLIATLLAELARQHRPGAVLAAFEFKAVQPLFDGQRMRVAGTPTEDGTGARLWASDAQGQLAMRASASFAQPLR